MDVQFVLLDGEIEAATRAMIARNNELEHNDPDRFRELAKAALMANHQWWYERD